MALKFTQVSKVSYWHVYAGVELIGTFMTHADAMNAAVAAAETGEGVIVYGLSHDSTQVLKKPE